MKKGVLALAIIGLVIFINFIIYKANNESNEYNFGQPNKQDKQIIYEVKSSKGKVYVMGVMHTGKLELYPLRKEIEEAFTQSKYLATERNLNRSVDPNVFGDSFENHTSKEAINKVKQLASAYDLSYEEVRKNNISAVMGMFQYKAEQKAGFFSKYGIDSYLTYRANKINKIIKEVEGLEYEIKIAQRLNKECSEEIINSIPIDIKKLEEIHKEGYEIVKTGNIVEASKTADAEQSTNSKFMKIYWEERNKVMTDNIEKYLASGETYFVAVGAGHVVGENGIIKVLQDKGYQVKRI